MMILGREIWQLWLLELEILKFITTGETILLPFVASDAIVVALGAKPNVSAGYPVNGGLYSQINFTKNV